MTPFDGMTAAHQTRGQLSGILCERSFTKEENILHITVCRFLNRYFTINDEHLRISNEEPTTVPGISKEEVPSSTEFGLLPPNE